MPDPSSPSFTSGPTSQRLDQVLTTMLATAPELQAAAVVSFDGLPMAAMLPPGMDEDRVAAMSAALLSLGERAAEGLGRGALSQVYVEGEHGTVFLVSADDEAVLVAVGAEGAKVGLLLFEVRRAAVAVAEVLRQPPGVPTPPTDQDIVDAPAQPEPEPVPEPEWLSEPVGEPVAAIPQPEAPTQAQHAQATDELWYGEPKVDVEAFAAPAARSQPPVTVVASTAAEDPRAPVPLSQETVRKSERRSWGNNGPAPRTEPTAWR